MLEPLKRLPDGTILSSDNRILYFSWDRFKSDICEGTCCFICGMPKNGNEFNDEHILPNWILRKFDLHRQSITLPNGQTLKYGSYKIPCCVTCNSLLGEELENPLSTVLSGGLDSVAQHHQIIVFFTSVGIASSQIYVRAHVVLYVACQKMVMSLMTNIFYQIGFLGNSICTDSQSLSPMAKPSNMVHIKSHVALPVIPF